MPKKVTKKGKRKPKPPTKPKYKKDQVFLYPDRREIFRITDVFWSYRQKQWMYTVKYPMREEEQYRRYNQERMCEECSKINNQEVAQTLYG